MLGRRLIALLLLAAPVGAVYAADNNAAFLDALRDRGHYDLALDYLNRAKKDPLTSKELAARIPYERAVTLLEQAQSMSSRARASAVEAARRDLEGFIDSGKDPTLAAEASMKLAAALRSGAKRDLAASARQSKKERTASIESAQQALDDARQYYAKAEKLLDEALKPLASVQPGSQQANERLALRFQLAQCRLASTSTLAEKARSYKARSKTFNKLMERAAKEFAGLYEKYDTKQSAGVGFYAHLYEGRSYLELGKHRLADGCFELLVTLPPEEPAFRRLITLAYAYTTQSLLEQKQHADALTQAGPWLEKLRPAEQSTPESLALKFQLAEASRLAAAEATDKGDSRELLRQAKNLYSDASRHFNEHQSEARLRLLELNSGAGNKAVSAKTFDEAYQIGASAIDSMTAARLTLDTSGGGAAKGQLQEQLQQGRTEAMAAYHQALELVEDDTPIARVNDVRSRLSRLYYDAEDYIRCAVIAEFVTTKFPSDPSAENTARLAMVAFDRLYRQAMEEESDTRFASDQLVMISEFVTRRWSGKPLADTAFGVLLAAAIRDNRLDDARRVLGEVAPDRRPPLELKLAIAAYEQATRAKDEPERLTTAVKALSDAVSKMRDAKVVSAPLASGALYLAQAKINAGDANRALAVLEDKRIGPLTLVKKKAAAANRQGFAAESYRTALQCYLATAPPRTSDAMKMMDLLEASIKDSKALTRTYFALGVRLQKQIDALNAAGKKADAKRVSEAFAEFVGRIGDAGDDADWVMQQWMAQTFLKLGEGLSDAPGDKKAKTRFFERARDGFQKLLDRAKKDPSSPPRPTSVLAVRMQLGNALRRLGEYEQAIDIFGAMLEEREMMLDVQKSAAYTYQEWGKTVDPEYLDNAIRGAKVSLKTGKNVIWGWSKLAKVAGKAARSQPKYRDLFFESWLNVATSRYLASVKAKGPLKKKQLSSARKTILLLSRQYPDLGGPQRKKAFDSLLKKIQVAEGAKPTGLTEFSKNAA